MNYSLIFLLCLPITISALCWYQCASCVGTQWSQVFQCASCYNNQFLYHYNCYQCKKCDKYDQCDQCSITNQSSKSKSTSNAYLYTVIFGSIAAAISISILIIIFYYKCKSNRSINSERINEVSAIHLEPLAPNLKWIKHHKPIDSGQNCAICLENNVLSITKCQHIYHPQCIEEWCLKRQFSCPLCKATQMFPLKFFCSLCRQNYIQIGIAQIHNLKTEINTKVCSQCSSGK